MTEISWVPAAALAKEFGVNRRTLSRWVAKSRGFPGFPLPRVFNRRMYFRRDEIEAWKAMISVKINE